VIHKSTSLKYEPSLELLRVTAEQLFSNRQLYRSVQPSVFVPAIVAHTHTVQDDQHDRQKSTLPRAIHFRAFHGTNLVTLWSKFRINETGVLLLVVVRIGPAQKQSGYASPGQ